MWRKVRAGMSLGESLQFGLDNSILRRYMEPSETFNPADLDKPEEVLAEQLGLTVAQAARVLIWAEKQAPHRERGENAELIAVIRLFWR